MPLVDWVSRRNNEVVGSSGPSQRLTVQEAQASKFQNPGILTSKSQFGNNQDQSGQNHDVQGQDNASNDRPPGRIYQSQSGPFTQHDAKQGELVNEENEQISFDPVNAFMQSNLAAMTQEQRNAAGFGHVQVTGQLSRRSSNHSYPSTTSGRVEENDEDLDAQSLQSSSTPTFRAPSINRQASGAEAPLRRNRTPTIELENHAAKHKQDLHMAYHAAQEARNRSFPNITAGTKRKSPDNTFSQNLDTTRLDVHPQNISSTPPVMYNNPAVQAAGVPVRTTSSHNDQAAMPFPGLSNDTELEYQPDTLFKMDFNELRNRPFDRDMPSDTVIDELEAAFQYSVEDQRKFFDSLSLHQWETSGAWFTEKFKELTEKLQQSRQDRRQLANEFEAEIFRRYEAVTAESTNLDSKLEDMGQKGAQVLSSVKRRE